MIAHQSGVITGPSDEPAAQPADSGTGGLGGTFVVTCRPDGTVAQWNDVVAEHATPSDFEDEPLASLAADDSLDSLVSDAVVSGAATATAPISVGGGTQVREFDATRVGDGDGASVVVRSRPFGAGDLAVDRMSDAFFAVDADWRLTYLNERATDILAAAMGFPEEATPRTLLGRNLWESIQDPTETKLYQTYHDRLADADPAAYEAHYDPLDAWFAVHAYPSEHGLSVYFREVTDRRERVASLRERERALARIYEVTADTNRTFAEKVNTLLELGCEVLDVSYGTLSRIRGDDYHFEHVHAPPGDDLEAGDVVPAETTNCERAVATEQTLVLGDVDRDAPALADRAGNADWGISCYLGAPTFADDEPYGTLCFYDKEPLDDQFDDWAVTLVDLLSQWATYELTNRRIHDRLAQRNDQLEEFASLVSHDLRSPLNVLDGSLSLAAETGDREHFERCQHAVDRMETLVEDLLSLARVGDAVDDPGLVDLAEVARDCWATTPTADASLAVATDQTVVADETRLRQVFENLYRNAVEHGGEDATVTVGTLDDDSGFYVADDGPGVADDHRDDLFDAGHSTDPDGTGFGLYIVSQVAAAHDWEATVTESEDGGARFEFTNVAGAGT
jgi:signal transduction histidine kinase